ncbi:MAG: cytochrome c biogenesis protein CcdA [Nitriliruptoraceae bacterium]
MEIPFAFAFTAGLVATLNPCGFAMLPAYLSYFMGIEDDPAMSTAHRWLQAVKIGGVVSAGFLTVFGLAGVLITLGVQAVVGSLPWIAMFVGVGVAGLGLAMLAGRELRVSLPKATWVPTGRGFGGVFVFGVSYAIASLSCTLPVFLVVVAGSISQLGLFAGVLTFLVYGLGMAVLLLVVTFALAFGKQTLVARLRRGSAAVNRIAGVILVLAGGYIVYFWAVTLQTGGQPTSGLVTWVEQLSARAVNVVGSSAIPIGAISGLIVAVVVVASLASVRRSRRRARQALRSGS